MLNFPMYTETHTLATLTNDQVATWKQNALNREKNQSQTLDKTAHNNNNPHTDGSSYHPNHSDYGHNNKADDQYHGNHTDYNYNHKADDQYHGNHINEVWDHNNTDTAYHIDNGDLKHYNKFDVHHNYTNDKSQHQNYTMVQSYHSQRHNNHTRNGSGTHTDGTESSTHMDKKSTYYAHENNTDVKHVDNSTHNDHIDDGHNNTITGAYHTDHTDTGHNNTTKGGYHTNHTDTGHNNTTTGAYHTNHTDTGHNNTTRYDYTTHTDTGFDHENFIPSKPNTTLEIESVIRDITDINMFSFDKNNDGEGTQDIQSKTVKYKLTIQRKTDAEGNPKVSSVRTLLNWTTTDVYSLNTIDPLGTGNKDPKLTEGTYEITCQTKNDSLSKNGVTKTYESPISKITVTIRQNVAPKLTVNNGNEFISFTFGQGGSANSSIVKKYGNLYSDAKAEHQSGLFISVTANDKDKDDYLKSSAHIKSGATVLATKEIIWENGNTVIKSDGTNKNGYVYFDKAELIKLGDKSNLIVEIETKDYKNSACTGPAASTIVQTKTLTDGGLDMMINTDITAPTIAVDKNGSSDYKKDYTINLTTTDNMSGVDLVQYQWTKEGANPTEDNWTNTIPKGSIKAPRNSDGDYYLNIRAYDRVGNKREYKSNVFKIDDFGPTIYRYSLDRSGKLEVIPMNVGDVLNTVNLNEEGSFGAFFRMTDDGTGIDADSIDNSLKYPMDSAEFTEVDITKALNGDITTLNKLKAYKQGMYHTKLGKNALCFIRGKTNSNTIPVTISCKDMASNESKSFAILNIMINKNNNCITGSNQYTLSKDKQRTLLFNRDDTIDLTNIVETYNAPLINVTTFEVDSNKKVLKNYGQKQYPAMGYRNFSNFNFKTDSDLTKPYIEKLYNTKVIDKDIDKVLIDNTTVVDILNNPIENLYNIDSTITDLGDGKQTMELKLTIKAPTIVASIKDKYGIDLSNATVALADTNNLDDNAVLSNAPKTDKVGKTIKATVDKQSARIVIGIPNVIHDSTSIESNLSVSFINIPNGTTTFTGAHTVKANIKNNNKMFSIPYDLTNEELKTHIRSIEYLVHKTDNLAQYKGKSDIEMYNLLKANGTTKVNPTENAFKVTESGNYQLMLKVTNKYGTERYATSQLSLVATESLVNGLRLKNDSNITLTNKGIYNQYTQSYAEVTIPTSSEGQVNPLRGFKTSSGNIVVISRVATSGNVGEIFDGNLKHIGYLKSTKSTAPQDLIEFNNKLYIANGISGATEIPIASLTKDITLFENKELIAPVYSLAVSKGNLLVGSSGEKALQAYSARDGSLKIGSFLSNKDIYGDDTSYTDVRQITTYSTYMELYPENKGSDTAFHIIMELP